ncbi:hypothetical protein [Nitrosophilus kaiyonis]|uniref:hypothetical protein n=1 Tax=Nitrosophilus kaiyonis TaxID=2930200 RepID=UPI002493B67B|nr:hypothetical protein [Nitrosophilus kaiyonis]
MAFLYLLIFLLLIFGIIGVVVYFFTELTKRVKFLIILSLIIGWLLIFTYSMYQDKKRKYHEYLLFNFSHGKTLICKDINVTKEKFNFVSGTLVFVGKEKTEFEGLVVPIDSCKIGE